MEQMTSNNPLNGLRVCLAGDFRVSAKDLNQRLRAAGVADIDRVTTASTNKENATTPPPVKETSVFVMGSNVPEDGMKRYELNCHDGFVATKITEEELYQILEGTLLLPLAPVEKRLKLDYSYYEWSVPVFNDRASSIRVSSPLEYDMENLSNVLYMKDIYVPDIPGVDMGAFRQLIGNFGGYANSHYDKDMAMVMLPDETIAKLKAGEQDNVILKIESAYNKSNDKVFNVQFTSQSDFLAWAKARLERFPDESSKALLDRVDCKNK